jgi:hypothetical protein
MKEFSNIDRNYPEEKNKDLENLVELITCPLLKDLQS